MLGFGRLQTELVEMGRCEPGLCEMVCGGGWGSGLAYDQMGLDRAGKWYDVMRLDWGVIWRDGTWWQVSECHGGVWVGWEMAVMKRERAE